MKAVITANDESGNIFKKIYLQDETGAIEMEVDQNSVYTKPSSTAGIYWKTSADTPMLPVCP